MCIRDRIGYGLEPSGVYNEETQACVLAFQRRWMQAQLTGQTDLETLRRIMAVLAEVEHS